MSRQQFRVTKRISPTGEIEVIVEPIIVVACACRAGGVDRNTVLQSKLDAEAAARPGKPAVLR